MAREMREVWVVRGAVGNVIAHVETEAEAATWRFGGNTIERLPLLTPHDAAVLEAAERYATEDPSDPWGYQKDAQHDALTEAVRARRAANAGGEG